MKLATRSQLHGFALSVLVFSAIAFVPHPARAASTNYDHAVTNDDGSVTLVEPQFMYQGKDYPIARDKSEDADFEGGGICMLYGFFNFQWAELEKAPNWNSVYPAIDPFGQFAGLVHSPRVYGSITCSH